MAQQFHLLSQSIISRRVGNPANSIIARRTTQVPDVFTDSLMHPMFAEPQESNIKPLGTNFILTMS